MAIATLLLPGSGGLRVLRALGAVGQLRQPWRIPAYIWGQVKLTRSRVRAARRLPEARMETILGAGHMVYLDSYDEFIGALAPFIRDDMAHHVR